MTRCARSRGLPERAESTADPAEFQMEGPALDAVSGATAFGQAEEPAASSQGDHLSGHHSQVLQLVCDSKTTQTPATPQATH